MLKVMAILRTHFLLGIPFGGQAQAAAAPRAG
jgi:hypothetical protein